MASCDDFSLLDDDHGHHHQSNPNHPQIPNSHHLHQSYAPHRFSTRATSVHAPPQPTQSIISSSAAAVAASPQGINGAEQQEGDEEEEEEDDGDDYNDAAFCSNPFENGGTDPNRVRLDVRSEKRKERDELSDGANNYGYNGKKSKPSGGAGSSGGEYRKDREEWSDAAIACLLDAYTDKFTQLNRGNLRGRDWEEVAATVSERCEKQTKSVEQCKNKVDNLKKRYKLERQRMTSGGISVSHWPWFKQMEHIVGNLLPAKAGTPGDDDKAGGSSATTPRQSKRSAIAMPGPVGPIINVKSKSMSNPRWRRVVFKVSGVALAGTGPNNIDPKVVLLIAREVAMACRLGVEVAIVVGGRNFFCGDTWVTSTGLERCTAYQIGMMATVMNSVLLQSALEKMGVQTRVQTAFAMLEVAEPYSRQRAIRHLEKGRVVIFGGIGSGFGNPPFSTDTAAAVRASEINAEAVLKGTNVDGVYDCNSRDNNFTFEHISFRDLATRGATSMDAMALNYCEENNIPVVVFNLLESGNISKALCGEQVGTLIDQGGRIS
ncbi:Uridylate kinase [Fagus crenata]